MQVLRDRLVPPSTPSLLGAALSCLSSFSAPKREGSRLGWPFSVGVHAGFVPNCVSQQALCFHFDWMSGGKRWPSPLNPPQVTFSHTEMRPPVGSGYLSSNPSCHFLSLWPWAHDFTAESQEKCPRRCRLCLCPCSAA